MSEIIDKITNHINELITLGKIISTDKSIAALEHEGLAYIRSELSLGQYWRGADIQVVKCLSGSNYTNFTDAIIQHNYSADEPCPSRFPELMTGLINRIQEKAFYLDAANKYEFYGKIAESAQTLEINNIILDKQTICRGIIFNQIRLLNEWRNELSQENDSQNLLEMGWKIYFGYGRNANQEIMLSDNRCPDAKFIGPAYLEDFKFIIDQSGYASVNKNLGSKVYGILWAVSPEDFERLDLREGLNMGSYRKENICVISCLRPFDEKLDAVIYISNRPQGKIPASGYIDEIRKGLISTGIGHDQISYLDEFFDENSANNHLLIENKPLIKKAFLPNDTSLPFFAYGLFKSDQIAHERIRLFVKKVDAKTLAGCFLAERDGIPLLGSAEQAKNAPSDFKINISQVRGEVITFNRADALKAYQSISALEPSNVYSWSTIEINNNKVNILVGKRIFKGSQAIDNESWSMLYHDPFIGDLEAMIERLIKDEDRYHNVIELQAAYIMIWTGIERLITLRYSMKKRTEDDILRHLSNTSGIANIFNKNCYKPNSFRDLYSSTKPKDKVSFVPEDTTRCIKYLRQIRHNVVHRGKGGFVDANLTQVALNFAHQIFKVLYKY